MMTGTINTTMNAIIEAGRYKVVFDMADVNFMSSKGWWVLIEVQKKCKQNGRTTK